MTFRQEEKTSSLCAWLPGFTRELISGTDPSPGITEERSMAADLIHLTMAFSFLVLWGIIGHITMAGRQS
jgi:hypothetical protein